MKPLPVEPLLAWTERALDLLEQLAAFNPSRPGAVDGCANQLASTLELLRPAVDDTDWRAILEKLERWETTHRPVLVLLPLTSSPTAELRAILESAR